MERSEKYATDIFVIVIKETMILTDNFQDDQVPPSQKPQSLERSITEHNRVRGHVVKF